MICLFFRNILIIIDKLFNVIFLGSPHKTISMRVSFCIFCKYVKPRYFWVFPLAKFIDFLFYNRLYCLEKNHVYNSYEGEEILSKPIWRWYDVVDQRGFDCLKNNVCSIRILGRGK